MKFYVYETDTRQKLIGEFLEKKGLIKDKTVSDVDILVLPFVNVEKNLEIDINQDYVNSLKKTVKVFTGVKNERLRKLFQENNKSYTEIMEYKEVSVLNSIPTAEGVLYNVIGSSTKGVFGSTVLVLGYGVCGSEIVRKLKALGANIDVIEQNEEKQAFAEIRGIYSVEEKDIYKKDYDYIINTIPEKIISTQTLKNISKTTIIFDIASFPYGFDEEEVSEKELNYKRLGSLPTKFGVDFSSYAIGNFIYKKMRGEYIDISR
ncbi:MAG: NAD(P)-dependent oxidoreductase [Lachnospirales bacterium]